MILPIKRSRGRRGKRREKKEKEKRKKKEKEKKEEEEKRRRERKRERESGQSPRRAMRRKVSPCILFLFLFLLLEGRKTKKENKRSCWQEWCIPYIVQVFFHFLLFLFSHIDKDKVSGNCFCTGCKWNKGKFGTIDIETSRVVEQ